MHGCMSIEILPQPMNATERFIAELLKNCQTIAVVGLSRDTSKDSYDVAMYMRSQGYRIIPINPYADEILGEKAYRSIPSIPRSIRQTIDLVNVFRPADEVMPTVVDCIRLRKKCLNPKAIWLQAGIINEEAATRASESKGKIPVVMDRCIKVEHKRLAAVGKSSA